MSESTAVIFALILCCLIVILIVLFLVFWIRFLQNKMTNLGLKAHERIYKKDIDNEKYE